MNATPFVSVRLSTLKGAPLVPFNVYVKVNQNYVPFIQQGDNNIRERLNKLREKKLKKIFIRLEEEGLYREFLDRALEMAFDNASDQPMEQRAEMVQGIVESKMEEVYEDPGNPKNYLEAKKKSEKYIEFLLSENEALQSMLMTDNPDSSVVTHGVTVATMAVALAQKLGINDSSILQILGFGALLHDIGHMDQEYELARPLKQFSQEELFTYHQHPQRAVDRLTEKQTIDPTVLRIIQQHEELIDGSGFPNSLRQAQQDPLAVIVSSCNAMDRLMSFEKLPREVAVKKLMVEQVGLHPLEHIQILQGILRAGIQRP